jgi:rhamnosyltransferase
MRTPHAERRLLTTPCGIGKKDPELKQRRALPAPTPSVVVRAKNKEQTIERALRGLREQTVPAEVILVDSGSTDGTVELARPYCDQVIRIAPEAFTYGHALNLGAEHAGGEVVFALSAHCVPSSPAWVELSLHAYADDDVAGTWGPLTGPDGSPLNGPAKFRLADMGSDVTWGFSNHASSWRKQVWERFPFDEKLVACEDKEWMWRVLSAGFSIYADPRLVVDSSHRRDAGLRSLYRRVYRERLVLSEMLGYPRLTVAGLLGKWWSDFPDASARPDWQRRFSPWRAAELTGEYTGDLVGTRRRRHLTHSSLSWGATPQVRTPDEPSGGEALAPGKKQP